jgi:RNA 2',3'-cyclic 3'-phosphodiesterase
VRLFVAIPLSLEVRTALGELIDRMSLVGDPVKWVDEENLHITVKFLGDTEDAKVDPLKAALDRAAGGAKAFNAEVKGTGAYPSPKHPRIIWAGFHPGEPAALEALVEGVERETEPLGFEREKREYSPHVTIGRSREGHQRRRPRAGRAPAEHVGKHLSEEIEQEKAFAAGTVRVDRIVLMRSQLGKGGPRYSPVHEAKLGK